VSAHSTLEKLARATLARGAALTLASALAVPHVAAQAAPPKRSGQASALQAGGEASADKQKSAVRRLKVYVGRTQLVQLAGPVSFVTVVHPGLLTADIRNNDSVLLGGVAQGETLVIAYGRGGRQVLLVEVTGVPIDAAVEHARRSERLSRRRATGSYTLAYTPSQGAGQISGASAPSLLRQLFSYNIPLTNERTLRLDGDLFHFFGDKKGAAPFFPGFGVSRLQLGLSAPAGTLEVLDSELNFSPLSFNSFPMRGLHLTGGPKLGALRGAKAFIGVSRPSRSLLEDTQGRFGGLLLPLARNDAGARTWGVRAGAIAVGVPRRGNQSGEQGVVGILEARLERLNSYSLAGDASFARGALSWRARAGVRRGDFDLNAEALSLDNRSPFIALGAQTGGRSAQFASVGWRPDFLSRLSAFVSFAHVAASPPERSGRRVSVGGTSLLANLLYQVTPRQRLGFRVADQKIALTTAPEQGLQLRTRSAAATHTAQVGNWSHEFEARLAVSGEERSGVDVERGLLLREEIRRSWEHLSVTGYFNHAFNTTPSLEGLVLRNPSILPEPLRRAYEQDRARFLVANRGSLAAALSGVELPESRDTTVGTRVQASASRYAVAGELRFAKGDLVAARGGEVIAGLNAALHIDEANSVGINLTRLFAPAGAGVRGGNSSLTVSLTHRTGAGGGGAKSALARFLPFSRLLGAGRGGRIEGRVYIDLNGNGRDDAGEPGAAGARVRLDGGVAIKTDEDGRYRFPETRGGEHTVTLVTEDLGVKLRATTPSQELVMLKGGRKVAVNFGVINTGSITGRVFNDVRLDGKGIGVPGVGGVRMLLRRRATPAGEGGEPVAETETNAAGIYEFRDLTPGAYTVELDPTSLPPDFAPPAQTKQPASADALRISYLNFPVVAQRAVSGVVYRDVDGDGRFDPAKDEPVVGARVVAGPSEAQSGPGGAYVLRRLPAGTIEIRVFLRDAEVSEPVRREFNESPYTWRDVNLRVKP
jgi:hypothetical protein